MFKPLVVAATILVSTLTAQAFSSSGIDISPNGSMARCQETSDAGIRAYRLSLKEISTTSLILNIDTLVCLRLEGQMTFVPYALSAKQTYHNNGHVIVYENIDASLLVTNAEATSLLARITIDTSRFSQEVKLDVQALKAKVFDISLQLLEVIRIDGKVVDQNVRTNGTYRINLN